MYPGQMSGSSYPNSPSRIYIILVSDGAELFFVLDDLFQASQNGKRIYELQKREFCCKQKSIIFKRLDGEETVHEKR